MKKVIFVCVLLILMVVVTPASAVKPTPVGDPLGFADAEYPAGMAFHISHGWIEEPTPGKVRYVMEMDGEKLSFDIHEVSRDPDSGLWSMLWFYNFPEGLTGTHEFIHHFYAPCGDSCDQPNKIVEVWTKVQQITFY
jgi:hypothetical protein